MMELFTTEMRRDPYPMYAMLRARSPVLQVPGADIWGVLDYEGVKRTLSDHEAFSSNAAPSRGVSFEWLLFTDPPRHSKLRALVMRAFTPRSIANLEPRIRELSRGLLEPLVERGEMDLATDFAVPLPMMVIAEMLGVELADWPRLKEWSDAIIGLGSTIIGSAAEASAASEAFMRAEGEMRDYLEALGAERRVAPRDDLVSRLVAAEVDGERLDELEIQRFVQLLLAAGTETTTNLIDNAILCFVAHPGELARVRADPSLLPQAIEEVVRYRSPAQAVFRATRRNVELGDQVIPAGKMVLAMIGSANRDPRQFRDPDRFDVGRHPNPHLAFGHGIHFCLGAPLSRLEGRIALGDLLERVTDLELAGDGAWEPRRAFHVHGPTSLPIRFRRAG